MSYSPLPPEKWRRLSDRYVISCLLPNLTVQCYHSYWLVLPQALGIDDAENWKNGKSTNTLWSNGPNGDVSNDIGKDYRDGLSCYLSVLLVIWKPLSVWLSLLSQWWFLPIILTTSFYVIADVTFVKKCAIWCENVWTNTSIVRK